MWDVLLPLLTLGYLWKIDQDVHAIESRVNSIHDRITSVETDVATVQRTIYDMEDTLRRIHKEVCPPSPIRIDF